MTLLIAILLIHGLELSVWWYPAAVIVWLYHLVWTYFLNQGVL